MCRAQQKSPKKSTNQSISQYNLSTIKFQTLAVLKLVLDPDV